jgi:hypothetical protein
MAKNEVTDNPTRQECKNKSVVRSSSSGFILSAEESVWGNFMYPFKLLLL